MSTPLSLPSVLDGAVFRIDLEGVEWSAPFDLAFGDLDADEARRAARLAAPDYSPERVTTALLFVKVQRHIPPLADDYFEAFATELEGLWHGDPSLIEGGP